jgi:hypothetical protein
LTAVVALAIGVVGAEPYARLAAPLYDVEATAIGGLRDWTVNGVAVEREENRPGLFLRLHGRVSAAENSTRSASLITRVQVGAVIEGPLIFWTLLAAWPATRRQCAVRIGIGLCVFLGLEAATTACQLLTGFSEASVTLAGHPDTVTAWDQWSRFLESGGRDVLAVVAALITVTLASRMARAVASPLRSS